MKIIRSWPCEGDYARLVAAGRVGFPDELPRLITQNYDYSPLRDVDDDVCIIEWDCQVSGADLEAFCARAAETPDKVLVAPQLLYHVAPTPVYAHRIVTDQQSGAERWIESGEEYCDYFAFGLIYLPRAAVVAFLDAQAPARGASPFLLPGQVYGDSRFNDQTFSMFYRWRYAHEPTRVDWETAVEHAHQ